MASIRDIARLSGYSVSMVSRVLNQHPYVKAEKRAHIQKIIAELDYTANQNAVNLSIGKTRLIGVISPYTNHACFDKIIKGILSEAFKLNYTILLLPTNYDPQKELKHLELLKQKRIDGLIITSRANPWETIKSYTSYGPITVCEETEHPELSAAYSDRKASYQEVFTYLKQLGHSNVAFTSVREKTISNSTQQLVQAYQDIFQTPADFHYLTNCDTYEDGLRVGELFLNQKKRPTAIYANGDEIAAGIYSIAVKKGINIPEDLLVVGEEDLSIGKALHFPSMNHQLEDLGKVALQLVLNPTITKQLIPHFLTFPN
ncbi:LacI family DNA-binding transcriptional regulator [Carnobacterium divergens]|uniref:LacI family DNA-binding transcriptional regulator n=1 Tax=Carnobacterium divergens TaxID=2748 RepID=UPI0007F350AC|nr:LacI family DNA-binding transcriptional regulator [Carnobacterium divergens]SBO18156.1 Catabolite control protein B [Carnobacterium divergens]